VRLKLITINRAVKIFNRDYSRLIASEKEHKFMAQNNIIG